MNAVLALFAGVSAGKTWAPNKGVSLTARILEPDWQTKSTALVDFMFRQADDANNTALPAGQRLTSKSQMWERFSDEFGDDPTIGAAWVDEKVTSRFEGGSAGATGRAGVKSLKPTVGLSAYTGLTHGSAKIDRKTQAVAGDVDTSIRGSATVAYAGAGVPLATAVAPIEGKNTLVTGGLFVTPLAGVSVETQLSGGSAIARLARAEDGSNSAFPTQLIMGRKRPEELLSALKTPAIRNAWIARLQQFDETLNPETAEAKLVRFEQTIAKVPLGGEQLFGLVTTLDPRVNDKRNDYEDVKKTLQGVGDPGRPTVSAAAREEIGRLEQEDAHLLNDFENSWLQTAAYAFEGGNRSNNVGLNFLAKLGKQASVSGDRLPALLVAARPYDTEPVTRT